ncbi:MAG: 50S ribosomal protein L4 [Rickettsiales bacterium]|jgi:large subunit ribosomal protein L4|nr:50S ribosomal protein L4 [Rickettsiales bacterium]
MKFDVITLDNKPAGNIELPEAVFGMAPRGDILARVIKWQLAKRRAGTHSTKTISEVSGTTRKPFAQKGTGRARQGSLRSPQMRGGATIFGPLPHGHAFDLPKKIRALGLKMALSAKLADKKLLVIDTDKLAAPKTKDVKAKLDAMKLAKVLFVSGAEVDKNFALSIANIAYIDALPAVGANVYDIIRHDTLALTKDAVEALIKRLGA